ncbi:MAG: hypothetical protein ACREEY_00350 [Brevundimonas sp.]
MTHATPFTTSAPYDYLEVMGPLDSELAMYLAFRPIVAEFETDPMSVQCFDLRFVDRAKWICRKFEERFDPWMRKNRADVSRVQALLEQANTAK